MAFKCEIQQLHERGTRQLCVYIVEGNNEHGRWVSTLYYDDIDRIDITSVWNEWDSDKHRDFQLDFLKKLRKYAKGFTIAKNCVQASQLVKYWMNTNQLNIEKTKLPVKKVTSCLETKRRNQLESAKLSTFDPNEFFWAYVYR